VPDSAGPSWLWAKIKRHKVVEWTLAYIAFAYAFLHGAEMLSDAQDWPHAIVRVLSLALILGVPMVALVAWYHGHRAQHRISGPEIVFLTLLLFVTGSMLWWLSVGHQGGAPAAEAVPKSPAAEGGVSIAVLPFVNLSSDKEQEFFSDGMTEEITSALAKVSGLRVSGRTSAFHFKGENKDLREIGRALGVTHLIEGSVRKAGDRVRITAQLIKANDDKHIWTDSYDGDLKDVFAVQEDVAKAIVAALQVPLGLKAGESLVANRTADTDSYQDYLRAKALVRVRDLGTSLAEPIGLLEQAVARDPNYAPAWALLAQAYALAPIFDNAHYQGPVDEFHRVTDSDLSEAEAAAHHAIALDARSADGYVALALVLAFRGRPIEAEDFYNQALKLDVYNPEGLHQYGLLLASVGKLKEAVTLRHRLQSIEPLVPIYNAMTAHVLWVAGQTEAALAMYRALPAGEIRAQHLSQVYASMGRYADAADVIENEGANIRPVGAAEAAVRLLRRAPQPAEDRNLPELGELDFVYLAVGLPERALDLMTREMGAGFHVAADIAAIFHPSYAPARRTKRFKTLMRQAGLVDYWRARGWPDLCRPVGTDDFVCD
jgi:TolB-like protein